MNQIEAARALGVTARTLRDWSKDPTFPALDEGGYDLRAIRAWAAARERQGSAAHQVDRELNRAIKAQKLRALKVQADRAERLEQEARLDLVRRSEVLAWCGEAVTLARDRLRAMPKQLARLLPRKHQASMVREGERILAGILDEFARLLAAGGTDEEDGGEQQK